MKVAFLFGKKFIQVKALGTFLEWHGTLADYEQSARADPHAMTCEVMTYLVTRRGLHWMSEDHVNGDIYRVTTTVPHRHWLPRLANLWYFFDRCLYTGYVLAERWPHDENPHFEEPKAWTGTRRYYVGRRILNLRWRPWRDTWGLALGRRAVSLGPFDAWFERRTAS